ncbi:unnamed protein product, partial [Allacma fusca]
SSAASSSIHKSLSDWELLNLHAVFPHVWA